MIEGARRLNQALAGEAHGVTTLPEQSTLPVINRAAMPAPAVQAGGQRGGDYGRGGLPVGNGRQPRRGATAPRAPFIVARLLPHLLVLAIVIAVVAGGGFWNPAVRVGPLRLETGQHPDLSVPVVQSSTNTSPAPVEQDAGTSYFTRPPLAITSTHLRIATYETKDGETINQIAARLGLKPATLLWANNLQDPAKPLLQGTKLRVPPTDGMLHQVQSNDTLDGIAAKYKVSTTAITSYRPNNVGGPDDLVPQSYVLVVGGQIPTREKVEPYTIRNGDTLWSIADRFGLSPSTLVWANNITNADVLVVGQTLIIPPVNGILHHVEQGETVAGLASKYSVKPEDITSFAPNGLGGGSPLVPGQDVMVPGGTPPAPPPPVVAAAPDPAAAPAAAPATAPAAAPAPAPAAPAQTQASGHFIWPATGALTTYFGDNPAYYGPGGHNGLDIANNMWTPLVAADGGEVIWAAWRGGLGYAVGIDHHNGFVTWYGHTIKMVVSPGDWVAQGQLIAYMGSTGNSTGPHVHFIIQRNGVYVDPLAYLPR